MSADDSGAEEGEPLDSLRDFCVWADEARTVDICPSLELRCPIGADEISCAIVPVCEHGGSLVVAVPQSAWNRRAANRLLPKGALFKPKLIEVAAVAVAGGSPHPVLSVKTWVGFLDAGLENSFAEVDPVVDRPFLAASSQVPVLPDLDGLIAAADSLFQFTSAASAPEALVNSRGQATPRAWEERMGSMERALSAIQTSLAQLSAPSQGAVGPKTPAPSTPLLATAPPPGLPARTRKPALDPGVVSAARASGISEDVILRMSQLAANTGSTLTDVPGASAAPPRPTAIGNPLSESEDEVIEAGGAGSGAPIEQAVLQLTKLVRNFAGDKSRGRDLNSILDRAETGGTEGGVNAGGRSKAAAYRKLKACLRDSPAVLYEAIEAAMCEDFAMVRSTPALAGLPVSSRGWVEHRSRLGPYPSAIRPMWILAAIHDCLKEGRHEEARARAALGLCAYDQSAADSGSWLLSQELLLEAAPPYQVFSRNRPGAEGGDVMHTRLADPRWVEVLMSRLRDQDAYNEARHRLSSRRKPPNSEGHPPAAESIAETPAGTRPPRGRGRGQAAN